MSTISDITARQILDTKGRPLVEVEVRTSGGHIGRGAAPTGQTVGMHESFVLRDNDFNEYFGLSVHKAVDNVRNVIAPALIGQDVGDQVGIDALMTSLDGSARKTELGGNAIYSASIACLRAAAAAAGRPVYRHVARGPLDTVPVPVFNVVNGGRTNAAGQAFSEFLIAPYRAESIFEAVEIGVTVFHTLAGVIERATRRPVTVGNSYGYAAPSRDPRTVLNLLRDAADECGVADKVAFALDCASSDMYDQATKTYALNGARVESAELVGCVQELTEEFDLLFVEDICDENDWEGFALAARELSRTLVLGDDLIVTNEARLHRAIREGAVNGFVLKPNQIGTISEALRTHETAIANGLISIPSGRSGGVVDDIVMDLAVGLQAPFQKNGAPRSGERIEKLNFLMRAAEEIGDCRLADLTPLARFSEPGSLLYSAPESV